MPDFEKTLDDAEDHFGWIFSANVCNLAPHNVACFISETEGWHQLSCCWPVCPCPTLQCKQESKRRITRSISQKYLLQSIWIVSSLYPSHLRCSLNTPAEFKLEIWFKHHLNILKPTIYVPIPEDESWWIFQLICFENTRHALRILNTCLVQQPFPLDHPQVALFVPATFPWKSMRYHRPKQGWWGAGKILVRLHLQIWGFPKMVVPNNHWFSY